MLKDQLFHQTFITHSTNQLRNHYRHMPQPKAPHTLQHLVYMGRARQYEERSGHNRLL